MKEVPSAGGAGEGGGATEKGAGKGGGATERGLELRLKVRMGVSEN